MLLLITGIYLTFKIVQNHVKTIECIFNMITEMIFRNYLKEWTNV
jgi:hypothetical protein